MRSIVILVVSLLILPPCGLPAADAVRQDEGSPPAAGRKPPARIHAIVDLGHEFTFYGDGRFHRQYLPGQPVATSWGSLFNCDLSNANLLVLLGCDQHLSYVPQDIKAISRFLADGGGVLLLGSAADKPQNELAKAFDCEFDRRAKGALKAATAAVRGEIAGGGDTLSLREPKDWEVLIADSDGKPLLARKKIGRGTLVVGARGLAGSRPDAKDNINAAWWQPLLAETAAGKAADPRKPFQGRGAVDYTQRAGRLTLHYSDYLKPSAAKMLAIYQRSLPFMEKRMGVPLSEGMASEVILLATGGGGFSSGTTLGLAVFWGDFPRREEGMIEFITHETVHSWVLPFAEIWNEPIATYVGDLVLIDMGYAEEGTRRIKATIERAAKIDPTMKLYDLDGHSADPNAPKLNDGQRNAIHWGKSFWIFEQLRKENPDFLAGYFQAKRKLATPAVIKRHMDANATVALLSIAMKRDLFPWFKEHGFDVDAAKSPIPAGLEARRRQEDGRWPAQRAWAWYRSQPWLVGFNYIPASAVNTTEMWQKDTFDPKTIDEELALARGVGFNCARVFLQYLVWEDDPAGFKERLEKFLAIADKHGMRTMIVLFDICNFSPHRDPFLGKQPEPIPGKYAHAWTPSPGPNRAHDRTAWPKLEQYVNDVVGAFAKDKRVLAWETWNEPLEDRAPLELVEVSFRWARQAKPVQPVAATVYGSKKMQELVGRLSDYVSFHNYDPAPKLEAEIKTHLASGRPVLCTEWMFRPYDSVPATCVPVLAKHRVAAFNWGLVNGKTQTHLHMRPTGKPPEVWQHDLFRKDRTPYDPRELEIFRSTIRQSVTGKATAG